VLAAGFGSDLVAFDAMMPGGLMRWRFHTGGTVYGQPAYDPQTGRIYFGSSDKHVYALDARGLFLWSFETQDNVAARPLVVGNLLVAASEDGTVYGLDAETGSRRWSFEAGDAVVSWPALVGDTVVIGSDDQNVYGLSPADGSLRWTFGASGPVEAPIVADDDGGTVYVASRDGTLATFSPGDCSDLCDAGWSVKPGGTLRSAPLPVEDRVIVIDGDGQLLALRAEDGKRIWSLGGDASSYVGAPILVGDAIVAATASGLVKRVSLDGDELGSWDARSATNPADGEPSFAYGPVVGGDSLWLADAGAVLRRLGAPPIGAIPSLSLAWLDQSGRPPFSSNQLRSSAVDHRGQAIVLDVQRGVYGLNPATGAGSKLADLPGDGMLSPIDPVLVGDTLLAISGRMIQALDLTSRQIVWQGIAPGTTIHPPAVAPAAPTASSAPGAPAASGAAGQTVLWLTGGDQGGSLLALDLATGAQRWQAALGPLTQVGGVIGNSDSAFTSTPPAAWDLQTGAQRWQVPFEGVAIGAPGLSPDGQTVYVAGINSAGTSGMVVALDAATGAERWRTDMDDGIISPLDQLWAVDDLVVVPDLKGKVIVLDAATGAERWRFTPPSPRLGNITVARGQVWLMLENARLYGLDLHNGHPTARLTDLELNLNGMGLTQRPVFVGDRLVFPAGLSLLGVTLPEDAP
jgi:outer membrane protein assembly factor BamB